MTKKVKNERNWYEYLCEKVDSCERSFSLAEKLSSDVSNKICWCWKWRKIDEAQKDELADRMTDVFKMMTAIYGWEK